MKISHWCSITTPKQIYADLKIYNDRSFFIEVSMSDSRVLRSTLSMNETQKLHYNDVIMGAIASQITSLTIVYSIFYSDADQRKHQSSASLAFVRGLYRGPVNSPPKWPVTRKMLPFDDVIMCEKNMIMLRVRLWYLHWQPVGDTAVIYQAVE